ncbi:uncharacterized protein LOC111712586 [Eurytemora carolleeae]|uniref:uncharacterized protein LOC111712586 n=1 Tax=Eurytemora carolleeae TaxID=1294199 RepID=UPI000C783E55|nr:uncharacterized protein LOC111712586 [Eurytemora carolleeae]|eukprot:XP_023343007.1 uncharacterized protein LOC111712586 [Eurytemora affinis]
MVTPGTSFLFILIIIHKTYTLDGEEMRLRHWNGFENLLEKGTGNVFLTPNNTLVVGNTGNTVTLPCNVNMENRYGVITWARLGNEVDPYTVLTAGDVDITTDTRVSLEQHDRKDEWNLIIRSLKKQDEGLYECQATTYPPQYIVVRLEVQEAYAEILGAEEKVFKTESRMKLVCQLRNSTSTPDFIFW